MHPRRHVGGGGAGGAGPAGARAGRDHRPCDGRVHPLTGIHIGPLGDAAIAIEFGRTIDARLNARVHALDRAIGAARVPGVRETVPAYASLLAHYDPFVVGHAEVTEALSRILAALPDEFAAAGASAGEPPAEDALEVPVTYGGDAGPDLGEVARHAGLSEAEVIRRHAAGEYRVAMLGFAPGFPYLMGMDPAIACPRLGTPRVRVPAGSIGIADAQTGIYPFAMPGGWRLIGRTDLRLFDPSRDPPATLRPGAKVRFVPVTAGEPDAGLPWALPSPPQGSESDAVAGAIRVVEPGILATVQDGGRWGYQRFGVPPSGAADPRALAAGNLAVGVDAGAGAVEITGGGAEFEFLAPWRFAITGADVGGTLRDRAVAIGSAIDAAAGDRLRLGLPQSGLRTYLCVAGGVTVPEVLGSRSTYLPAGFGGFAGRALRSGDVLPVGPAGGSSRRAAAQSGAALTDPTGRGPGRIELPFIPGGQWLEFPAEARHGFVARAWRVSHRSDRIGLRLEGDPLDANHAASAFVSDGTVTGAIQVSGDGLPIVLLVDRQTTGGYPKLGAVASVALHHLGQAQAGDEIVFRPMSIDEAEEALRDMRVQGSSAHA